MNGIKIEMAARPAIVRINAVVAKNLNMKEPGEFPCRVLGVFQETESEACAYPVFVIEFLDGRCCAIDVDKVTFTDIIKEEE